MRIACISIPVLLVVASTALSQIDAQEQPRQLNPVSEEFIQELRDIKLLMELSPPVDPEKVTTDLEFGISRKPKLDMEPVPAPPTKTPASQTNRDSAFRPVLRPVKRPTLPAIVPGIQASSAMLKLESESAGLTPESAERKSRLERCLAIYYTRQVDAGVLRPWSIMHGLIGYGQDTSIIHRGKRHNAIEYLCDNGIGDDRKILYVENGNLRTRVGIGVQGHEAQLLAMLAQSDVPIEQPVAVDGHQFTVEDLVKLEMQNCQSNTELTFRLLGLSHYLQSETEWKNEFGETWSLSRLVREELAEPVNDGACGGSHRLMALSYALAQRRGEQLPIDGDWFRADKFITEFQNYSWSLQHKNGSFSTGWFREKSFSGDPQKSLYTTGHILEWLVYSLPEDQLDDPRVTRAVDYLLNVMMSAPNYDLSVGPRGHALRALRLYEQKVFEKTDYTQLMNDARLVNNNPQNGGGASPTQTNTPRSRTKPAGFRRGIFGLRR